MWVVLHYLKFSPSYPNDEDGEWIVDYISEDKKSAYNYMAEFQDASPETKFYIGKVK